MPDLNLNTYQHQFARVTRYYNRFRTLHDGAPVNSGGAPMFDDVLSFFMHCHHLRDWVINDPQSGWSKNDIDVFVGQHDALPIVADICNGAKHLKRNRAPDSGHQPTIRQQNLVVGFGPEMKEGRPDVRIRIEVFVEHGDRVLDAFVVATEAFNAWDTFFKTRLEKE